ncbi:hypothetical protein ASD58_15150 [Duganella sp. Root1480D1]|nr:hypothetical protein ASD58_15150 [Duganella sp. Root1480D1]
MRRLFSRDNRRLRIERLKPPCIGHHGKRRAALDWWRRRDGLGAKLRWFLVAIVPGLVPILRTGAFSLAQSLHEQTHSPPAGRAGIR